MLLARFDQPLLDLSREERVRLLGGKGDGLMRMAGELGLPVPPGFVLTTRACELYLERGFCDELEASLREGMAWLEETTGRSFGSEAAGAATAYGISSAQGPLLVSVRSGAPVSMPGMLDTLLNVGLDERTTAALARESERLAASCRARLESSFRDVVGSAPPADVFAQLRTAVEAVFRSARAPRALAYRRREGLAGDALTAVNVQTMVFGHRDARSATGVFFTRDPSTGEARPFGDVLFEAQGEDVVSGRHATLPYHALASRLPDVARELDRLGRTLEETYRDLCEIEFTIESGRLW
ncbi:pyruvate, phosphate dikinase, partial [Myxococcota bacterium]|nr:pyruvate, phosphate dikinase [Myxococcota bacterium]